MGAGGYTLTAPVGAGLAQPIGVGGMIQALLVGSGTGRERGSGMGGGYEGSHDWELRHEHGVYRTEARARRAGYGRRRRIIERFAGVVWLAIVLTGNFGSGRGMHMQKYDDARGIWWPPP